MREVIIVSFYWIDSERSGEWSTNKEDITRYAYTEGILIRENERSIMVSSSIGGDEDCLTPVSVPYVAIKNGKRGIKKVKKKINQNI